LKQKRSKRGRPKKKKGVTYWGRLTPLVLFLNLDSFDRETIKRRFNSSDTSDWDKGDQQHYRQYAMELYIEIFRESSETLKWIHGLVTERVIALIDPIPSRAQEARRKTCEEFSNMPFKPHWHPLPDKGSGPLVDMDFKIDRNKTTAPNFYFYGLIIEACMTREVRRLRQCPQCRIFFMATESRQVFCIPEHARLYYDTPERAKERVDKSRGKLNENEKEKEPLTHTNELK
jgi:hypothetical protein